MRIGLILLTLAYVLSQFFRAFLAVLTGELQQDLGVDAQDLAFASGLWFISFAAMQIPVGWALDTFGPRRTSSVLMVFGCGIGAAYFAFATSAMDINIAMTLIGIGCAPILMASFYIFAREFSAKQFATLAGLIVGVGTIGNLISSYPMALAVELVGWRVSMMVLSGVSIVIAIGLYFVVKDPAKAGASSTGSLLDILRMPVIWVILPIALVNYMPAAAVRGIWIGPYLRDVFGYDTAQVGIASLVMSIAMIGGVLLYGPLDRIFGTRKWVIVVGTALTLGCIGGLWAFPATSPIASIAMMAGLGFFGGTFPVIMAHGKAFFPAHLAGRGVTLMNLFSIGGVGLAQFATGQLHTTTQGGAVSAPYSAVFGFLGLALAAGLAIYVFSKDNTQ
jgi:sugar phosphate permease